MIKTGTGVSKNSNSFDAGKQATEIALEQAKEANLLVVFSTSEYDQIDLIKGVRSVAKDIDVVGCSDAGEITSQGSMSKNVVVMALITSNIEFVIGVGKNTDKNSFDAGKQAAEEVKEKSTQEPSLIMLLSDGLAKNGADVVRGVQKVFGKNFPIIGGSAGDDFAFKKTYQYYNDQVFSNTAIAIGFCGDFSFGIGVRHGWDPIGLPLKVTKSDGAKLIEINNRPALSIYQDYFGKDAEELTKEPIANMAYTYPLGMSVENTEELLLRDVVIANEKGEITCAAEIPEKTEVRLMIGDQDKAIQAAKEAAEQAMRYLNGTSPKVAFVFDCIARWKLLSERRDDEIKAIQNVLGKDTALIGFYTYGEQAPLSGILGDKCLSVFHNETMVILALGE